MAGIQKGKEINQGILPNSILNKNSLPSTLRINSQKKGLDSNLEGDDKARPAKKVKVELQQRTVSIPLCAMPMSRLSNVASVSKLVPQVRPIENKATTEIITENCKQFWKAGDYEGAPSGSDWECYASGSDHIRVHPRFLHSNATSHRWVLGAFAELLDNSLDEVLNEATFVRIDMMKNKKTGDRMLVIEDNGGGMDPIKLRQCMSLGYSSKSKIASTIGQYGNGFKTSTMRLGADVIVFSRFYDKDGKSSTQSIGLLSYTFLRCSKKEDIEVPILDYEKKGQDWSKIGGSTISVSDWNEKVNTIIQWSPFSSETNLLEQFNDIKDHGTRIFIYNLWEDDQGELELDFDTDPHDIQIRGVNRDDKNIQMAQKYPNSRHFLTYRHSLRSYASILYLRVPPNFRVILRGKDVEHHNIVNDMMMTEHVTYRPQHRPDRAQTDYNMVANVTVGFVKDARDHIDVQGFNVYYKNRLIKPFWRVWHPAGSDGRGVIGVLEANFVEPAHDKQGFERTIVLSRLENKLAEMQKSYWTKNCHKIGYAPRQMKKSNNVSDQNTQEPKLEKPIALSNIRDPVLEKEVTVPSNSMQRDQNGHLEKHNMENKASRKEDNEPFNDSNNDDNEYSLKSLSSHRFEGKDSSQIKKSGIGERGTSNINNNPGNIHVQKSSLRSKILQREGISETVHASPFRISGSTGDTMVNIHRNENGIVHHQRFLPLKKSLEKYGAQIVGSSSHKSPTRVVVKNDGKPPRITSNTDFKSDDIGHGSSSSMEILLAQNRVLKEILKMRGRECLGDLLKDLDKERRTRKLLESDLYEEKGKYKALEAQLEEAKRTIEEQKNEQDKLIDIFSAEMQRRDIEEENLRNKLKGALN